MIASIQHATLPIMLILSKEKFMKNEKKRHHIKLNVSALQLTPKTTMKNIDFFAKKICGE
jgi:hypothetical protein